MKLKIVFYSDNWGSRAKQIYKCILLVCFSSLQNKYYYSQIFFLKGHGQNEGYANNPVIQMVVEKLKDPSEVDLPLYSDVITNARQK